MTWTSYHKNQGKNQQSAVQFDGSGTHSANFDEKVHKPQSRSHGNIGAKMQLFYTYLICISASPLIFWAEGLQGTHMDALNTFSSKLMALTPVL